MALVADLVTIVEEMAPPTLAEPWDNAGLLVGDPKAAVEWVAVALDADHALSDPPASGPGLLVVHHPLPFRPLNRVVATDPTGRLIAGLVRGGIALMAAHTAYDSAPAGLGQALAETLGLKPDRLRPLAPSSGPGAGYIKLVVFVPTEHVAAVRDALGRAGAGHIGEYSDCAFASPGRGYFRPGPRAVPYLGKIGRVEEAPEERVETILPAHRLEAVVRAVLAVHPYEEVAYDVFRLEGHPRPELIAGIGRVGELDFECGLDVFRSEVERRLNLSTGGARLVNGGAGRWAGRAIRRVAVCPGAGGDYVAAAAQAGADVYVTGDIGYHAALEAARLGLPVIDAGHAGTEALFVPHLAGRLRKALAAQGIPLPVGEFPPLEMGEMG